MVLKTKVPVVQDSNQTINPLKRLYNLPPKWYSEKELRHYGFSYEDISYLRGLEKETNLIIVKSKRSLHLIFIKKDRLYLPTFVRLIPVLLKIHNEWIPVQWFSKNKMRQEALPILDDHGILKKIFVNGKPCFCLSAPVDQGNITWIEEISRTFNIPLPRLSKVIALSVEAMKRASIPDSHKTEKIFLWKDAKGYWQLSTRKSISKIFLTGLKSVC
ncbi:MAG: hypothetical protein ACXAEU_10005 [Candidatus Hodarchaeales archaeon]|jgi:hypothetical protein